MDLFHIMITISMMHLFTHLSLCIDVRAYCSDRHIICTQVRLLNNRIKVFEYVTIETQFSCSNCPAHSYIIWCFSSGFCVSSYETHWESIYSDQSQGFPDSVTCCGKQSRNATSHMSSKVSGSLDNSITPGEFAIGCTCIIYH